MIEAFNVVDVLYIHTYCGRTTWVLWKN